MAGIFGLSINPDGYKRAHFSRELLNGTQYQRHLGEDKYGLASFSPETGIICHNDEVSPSVFKEKINKRDDFKGIAGIGYCGKSKEPREVSTRFGVIALCFSGRINNKEELIEKYQKQGHSFSGDRIEDIEIIEKIIVSEKGIVRGLKKIPKEIKEGAYSLLVLTQEGIYAAVDSASRWPFALGKKRGAIIVASDSSGFDNLGFKFLRDLEPGEILLLNKGGAQAREFARLPKGKPQYCSFLWVYYFFPRAQVLGIRADDVRIELGRRHARRDIEQGFFPDVVSYIPDSGRFYAIGYEAEYIQQNNEDRIKKEDKIKKVPVLTELLTKYPLGRSFIRAEDEDKKEVAYLKQIPARYDLSGLRIVICDDSIVTGNQSQQDLIPKIKKMGPKEIHLRIGNPEIFQACKRGDVEQKTENLFSNKYPLEEDKCIILGVESVKYSSIQDLVEAIGLPREHLCLDCDLRDIPNSDKNGIRSV